MENDKKKEKGGGNDSVVTLLEDNPCWGSPTRHTLEDLLSIVDRNTSIVHDSPQYLVLNKPPDLRMDGPYPATVHKLLTYWYPPPSLSELGKCRPKPSDSTESQMETETVNEIDDNHSHPEALLLEAVSRLHRHNDVRDNYLRPCHQLDYATSGVLLVAKTKQAAGHISRLFEERHKGVQKSYTAVVVGDLREGLLLSNTETGLKVPTWKGGNTTSDLREQLQRVEETYRRSRAALSKQHNRLRAASKDKDTKKEKKSLFANGTFQGFQPAHSIFAKWKSKFQASAAEQVSIESTTSPRKKRQKRRKLTASALLTDDDWQRIWGPVNETVEGMRTGSAPEIDFEAIEWKQLRKQHPTLKKAFIQATDIHNDILRDAVRIKEQEKDGEVEKKIKGQSNEGGKELPVLFRLSEDSKTADGGEVKDCTSNSGADDVTFYVCCPLAQHPDQFNMVVPTSLAKAYPRAPSSPAGNVGSDIDGHTDSDKNSQLKFRPSLTKCTILERGKLSIMRNNTEMKIDVTKVQLNPMTGRRHQLRVHMALAGFPILGDVAYGGEIYADHENDQSNDETERNRDVDVCPRMCLHAQFLQLPTLLGESEPDWKIATADPFVFGSDGKLHLNFGNENQ